MEEIKVSEMLQADSINKDDSVMIIQEGVNKKAGGSIQTATGTSLSLTSVADTCKVKSNSKNLFDKDNPTPVYYANNASYSILENGIRIIKPSSGATTVVFRIMDVSDKVGETFTLKADFTSGGQYIIGLCDVSGGNRITGTIGTTGGEEITYTIPEITTSSYLAIWLYGDSNTTGNKDYTNIQLEQGSTATDYNPYNTEVGIFGKNLINSSLFIQGDFSLSNTTTRLVIGQKLYLRAGTYTISTNLNTNVYRYYINTLKGPIGSTYGSQKYNSGWQTSSSFTFTLSSSEEGYFAFVVGKIDGSTLLAQEMANYNFQLEKGDTATTYERFEGQYLDLIPDETKSAFAYDSLTNILSNGSVTIEYNTQSRLLNNDDVLDIVEPVKEYVDEKSQDTYSTEEKEIGTWIDGKPLYRRVIEYTIPSGITSIGISLGIANIQLVQKMEIRCNAIGTGDYEFGSYYSGSSDYKRFFMRSNELQVRLSTNTNGMNIVAIVEYTKTTD